MLFQRKGWLASSGTQLWERDCRLVGMGKGDGQTRLGMWLVLCFSSTTLAFHPDFDDTIWDAFKPHALIELNGTTATQWNFTVEFDTSVMAFNPVRLPSQLK